MPNTEIKLIATDLDGTLLRDDHLTLSPANREALTRAAELSDGPAFALGRVKSLLAAGEHDVLAHQLVRERENFVASLFHHDAGEGIEAFLEKRPPRFNRDAGER